MPWAGHRSVHTHLWVHTHTCVRVPTYTRAHCILTQSAEYGHIGVCTARPRVPECRRCVAQNLAGRGTEVCSGQGGKHSAFWVGTQDKWSACGYHGLGGHSLSTPQRASRVRPSMDGNCFVTAALTIHSGGLRHSVLMDLMRLLSTCCVPLWSQASGSALGSQSTP